MKGKRNSLFLDLSFIIMLMLIFVCVAVTVISPQDVTQNMIILCVIFALMIVTYFTSITAGLVINLILIFGYVSVLLYNVVVNGVPNNGSSYVFLVVSPMLTAATGMLFRKMNAIEREFVDMQMQVKHYATIDEETGLKTKHAYEQEWDAYLSIARRYDMQLVLIVWEFRFHAELERYLSNSQLSDLAVALSNEMRASFRNEDVHYIMEKQPYRWGMLALVKPDGAIIIRERLRKRIESIDLRKALGKHAPRLDIRIGAQYQSDEIGSAQELYERAVAQMQYDVSN